MIHIVYVPGMFGSTIDYVLNVLTNRMCTVEVDIAADGSMHTHAKKFHPATTAQLIDTIKTLDKHDVTNIFYPMVDGHLPDILTAVQAGTDHNDRFVLVHANCLRDAELNLLFQFHKIVQGTHKKLGLGVICGDNRHNIMAWNANYQHWSDMRPWELREWLSLFYVVFCQEWIESPKHVDATTLCIANTDILTNFVATMQQIILHCGLNVDLNRLEIFADQWQVKQQYVVDQFQLLDEIVSNSVNNIDFEWATTNIVAEAIVQQRLRAMGYEIRCDGLDIFPTDAKILHSLLYKVKI